MLITGWHQEFLWLSFRQPVHNGEESINVLPSKLNSPDYTEATRKLIDIAVALDALEFFEHGAARRKEDLGGDRRSIIITRRPIDGRILFFIRCQSLFFVDGLSLVYPWFACLKFGNRFVFPHEVF